MKTIEINLESETVFYLNILFHSLDNEVEVKPCTSTRDTECQCKEGYIYIGDKAFRDCVQSECVFTK